jgi:hypothetical protein
MKNIKITSGILFVLALLSSCEKFIDLKPESYESTDNYYKNYEEINVALMGCVGGMRAPLNTEWMLTEVRTDNAKQSSTGSSSTPNLELNELDMYTVSSEHLQVYNYWYSVYKNINSLNLVIEALGVKYNPVTGVNEFAEIPITLDEEERNKLAGEALFIRAYHYFNLVRLFGGVFLLSEPVTPPEAKKIDRSTVDEMYKFIIADLQFATSKLENARYDEASMELGLPSIWAAKALLAKVYLTRGNKDDAFTLLTSIILNSKHTLLANYSDVFSITNEMNAEIIFAVRFKAGGLGIGSPFANLFAASNSGAVILNGDGSGYNYPTTNFDAAMPVTDLRKAATMSIFGAKLYVKKFLSPVTIKNDAENDFPVIRYADVLLMMAEALGYPSGIPYINKTRVRAGLEVLPATVNNQASFEAALLKERRLEFAFENHRFFDLVRLNALIPTIKAYYESEYTLHYSKYKPTLSLITYQSRITEEKILLPIPQREIDTNNDLVIQQNPGY